MGNFHTAYDVNTLFKFTHLNAPLTTLDRAITYLKNIIMSCDGSITWSAGTLTWANTIRIHFNTSAGLAVQNTIAAGNIALSDNEFAYIDLSETNDAVLTVSKAAITTASASNFIAYNRLVLGYRNAASDEFFAVYLKNVWSASTGDFDPDSPGEIGGTSPDIVRGKNKEIFKTANADSPLTAAECCGTIVSNYGMTDADCSISLPTAVAGLSFLAILPSVRARYFKFRAYTNDKIYLSGTAGSDNGYVGVASGYGTGAACSFFTFKASDGNYGWFAIPLTGTWVAS